MVTRKAQASRIDELAPGEETVEEYAAPLCAPTDALGYIRDMAAALRDMAEDTDQILLAYLLDMAHEEARLQSRRLTRSQT